MFKTANCIKILQILSSGRIYKSDEIAERLNINKRNITDYITELKIAGYDVECLTGKNGGYRLAEKSFLPKPNLTEQEIFVLKKALQDIKVQTYWEEKEALAAVLLKILINYGIEI